MKVGVRLKGGSEGGVSQKQILINVSHRVQCSLWLH